MPKFEGNAARKTEAPPNADHREYLAPHPVPKRRNESHEAKIIIQDDQETAEALRRKIAGATEEEELPEAAEDRSGIRRIALEIIPPPKDFDSKKAEAWWTEHNKKMQQELRVSIAEARRTVPHGDRIWEFVNDKFRENELGRVVMAGHAAMDPQL